MKILLVTNLFPIPADPERGVFTLQLARRLQHHGEVDVVCPLPWFPRVKPFTAIERYAAFAATPRQYTIDDIRVYAPRYPLIPKISENIHAGLMALGLRGEIRRLHRLNDYDLLNSQWLYPDSVACDGIARRLGLPHVATGLGCDVNRDLHDTGKRQGILRMLQRCEGITVVSNGLKHELTDNGIAADKIAVIPNGIDTDSFRLRDRQACRERLGLDANRPMLLYVGRLSDEKDPATLIAAIGRLAARRSPPAVYLVGDGPLRGELEARLRSLDLADTVHFVGKVAHAEVGTWMGACDYLCLSSIREGCPNVILESLGSGRPVIASNVGAIPDLVEDFSGILFTPGDFDQLADAIDAAMSRSWSDKQISQSMARLSWEAAAESYIASFRRAMDSAGDPGATALRH